MNTQQSIKTSSTQSKSELSESSPCLMRRSYSFLRLRFLSRKAFKFITSDLLNLDLVGSTEFLACCWSLFFGLFVSWNTNLSKDFFFLLSRTSSSSLSSSVSLDDASDWLFTKLAIGERQLLAAAFSLAAGLRIAYRDGFITAQN